MRSNILIVEDDPAMRRGLEDNFRASGYAVRSAADGEGGLRMALESTPDLMVLDVMLPGINGFEICRRLREDGRSTPTIMLTAKDEEADMLLGFGVGVDDYMTKPFSVRELLARSEALLRRAGKVATETPELRFGDWVIDQGARELHDRDGACVPLSPKEYELLVFLASKPGRALSRDQIMNAVWGYGCLVTPRSIDRFVTCLRRKIEARPRRPQHILTVREFDYRFER